MARPSNRKEKQADIIDAFMKVFAASGYAGATIAAVAAEADLSPGLLHHHFKSKAAMLERLLEVLIARFRGRDQEVPADINDPLQRYIHAALKLDARSDIRAARCWVGLFAEAVRNPRLFRKVSRLMEKEIERIQVMTVDLDEKDAAAIFAFIVGALVVGAFAPRKTAGFALPTLQRFVAALE